MKTDSVLEKVFATGELAVTGECGPPRGALPDVVKKKPPCSKDMWMRSM
jgi:methylenetetrahydrofolate reductase (NADPH)